MRYEEPLFRPPSEAYSMIFQATIGCSWNTCAFCEMYTSKKFRVKPEAELFEEIEYAAEKYGAMRKIFLADGNAMVLSSTKLIRILDKIHKEFQRVSRISAYALPSDILNKTPEELQVLHEKGLKLLYVGIESGDDELLQAIHKSETMESTIKGLQMAREAGIKLSVMILNGLGGKLFTKQHALNSAKVVNAIQPEYLSTLVLSHPYGESHYKQRFNGDFDPLDKKGLIEEMGHFIDHLELDSTIFRSDHASNYLVLKGTLNRDKEELMNRINTVLDNFDEGLLRPEWSRGL